MTAPGRSEEQGLQFPGFTGGLNTHAHPSRLEPSELRQATNVIFGPRGEVKNRHGLADFSVFTDAVEYKQLRAWNTDQIAGGAGTQAFFSIKNTDDLVLNYKNVTRQELVLDSTGPDGGDQRFNFIVMNGLAYVSSVVQAHEVTPATPSKVDLTAWDPDAGNTTTNFPRTDRLLVAYERVFASRLADGPTEANKYRLYFSEPLLPKTWTTTNYVDINPDDSQPIQSFHLFADQIIIFKDKSIWGLAGSEFEGLNVKLYQIEGAIGTTAPETVVDIGALLMFLDPSSGIYLFDGSAFQNVGEPIFDTLKGRWDSAAIHRSTAWYSDGRYFLSVPINGKDDIPTETYVYDTRLQAWSMWDRGFQGAMILPDTDDESVMVVGRSGTFDQFNGTYHLSEDYASDDGANIDIDIKTGWLAPTGSATKWRTRQMVLDLMHSSSNTVVSVMKDQIEAQVVLPYLGITDLTIDTSDGDDDGLAFRTHAFNFFRWRSLAIRIEVTCAGSPWQLNGLRLVVRGYKRFRSELTSPSNVGP